MEQEKVTVEEVAESARRIVIRLDIGTFTVSGPADNILTVESMVAFSTVVNELYREGYRMVTPEEYSERYGTSLDDIAAKIRIEGSLFLLRYDSDHQQKEAVPLEEQTVKNGLGPHLSW